MDADFLIQRLMLLIPLWLSLSVHEWAHAYSAYKLGDDTAKSMGRMTLNPLAHIDPIGTLLLPLMGVPFGWAKPVPVNPLRFTARIRMQMGMLISAAAGPLSNLVLAFASVVMIVVFHRVLQFDLVSSAALFQFLTYLLLINIILAVFNMLPIYPLDGSRVAEALVPEPLMPLWENFRRISPLLLIAVILAPILFNFSLIEWPVRKILQLIQYLIMWL